MATRIISKSFSSLFENGSTSIEEDQNLEEMKEYYSEFFQFEHFVHITITGYNIVETSDEKYTAYIIHAKLPFTEYNIEKRYTQFFELYKKIERRYKNIDIGKANFPSKQFFGKFNESTIQYRTKLLTGFLNVLLENYQNEEIVEFFEFLEVKKRIEMLIRLPTMESGRLSIGEPSENSNGELDDISYYLNIFDKNTRDLCRYFKEFQTYILEKKQKLTRSEVKKLLYGDHGFQGLIHLCGKIDCQNDSHLTCGPGLQLLCQLLDYESNKDAEIFNIIFGSTGLRELMWLNFDKHIQGKGFRPCKQAAMKLLNNFLNQNPSISVDQILSETEVIQEFELWKNSNQTTSIKAESFFRF